MSRFFIEQYIELPKELTELIREHIFDSCPHMMELEDYLKRLLRHTASIDRIHTGRGSTQTHVQMVFGDLADLHVVASAAYLRVWEIEHANVAIHLHHAAHTITLTMGPRDERPQFSYAPRAHQQVLGGRMSSC